MFRNVFLALAMDSLGLQVGADAVSALEPHLSRELSHAADHVVIVAAGVFALLIPIVHVLGAVGTVYAILAFLLQAPQSQKT